MRFAKLKIERRDSFPAFLCFLLSLFLFGCEPVFEVTPASNSEMLPNPRFKVTDPQHPSERPRYHSIKLYTPDGKLLWHVRAEPFGDDNSVAEFTYGMPLKGFQEMVPPAPLEHGHSYTLFVFGTPTGTYRFSSDSSGHIIKAE